jgi:hypothetical protein
VKLGKARVFITKGDIPRDVAFTEVAWVCSIRTGLWLLMTIVILLVSWTCLPIESSVAFFFWQFYVPHWRGVCPSALVHSYYMAFPFPLEIWKHCYDVRVGTLFYVRIRHFVTSYNLQYYLLQFPLTSLEHTFFPVCERLFGAPYIRARNMQDSRTVVLSPVFGICWPI